MLAILIIAAVVYVLVFHLPKPSSGEKEENERGECFLHVTKRKSGVFVYSLVFTTKIEKH